jgi:alpha-L-rhamnosidase
MSNQNFKCKTMQFWKNQHHNTSCTLLAIFMLLCYNFTYGIPVLVEKPIPENLKCEYFHDPMGIDVSNPTLSWTIKNSKKRRGIFQRAYQVVVSEDPQKIARGIGEVWDSGKINAYHMDNIRFSGKSLRSSTKYWWRVRIWDDRGNVSNYSPAALFVTGIINQQDWKGKWISALGADKYAHQYISAKTDFNLRRDLPEFRKYGPKSTDANFSSMLLRKSFSVKQKLKRAILHIIGLGQYELTVNGKGIGKGILSPGWTDYTKTALYDTFDLTEYLKTGSNAIGIILGNSMYNIQPDSIRYVKFLNSFGPLKASAMLRLEYSDESFDVIGTDSTWKVSPGPITYSNFYGGEDYDARLNQSGWDMADFKMTPGWSDAMITTSPGGQLRGLSYAAAPIEVIETIKPVKITKLSANRWVFDLGQNASIMPRIRVKGSKGAYLRIIPAELLKPDGSVDRTSATQDGVRPAWWQYTIGSSNSEKWFPKFFYQGGRYLQVETFAAEGERTLPVIEDLKGVVVHSSAKAIGTFSSSNQLFNSIYALVRWAQRSNMMSIMTDCPQREKQGWLEQYHLNGPSLRYNFDLVPLFRKVMNDMSDSQLENGLIPNIAPEFFHATKDINNGFRNSPEWGSSFIIVPWQQYLFNGDRYLIQTYYPKMKRYIAFLESTAKDHIIYTGLGDWYDIGPKPAWGSQLTPVSFTATAVYFYDNQIMSKMAGILGLTRDSVDYWKKSEEIKRAFNLKFFKENENVYSTRSNTTYAMPVFFGMNPEIKSKSLIDSLVSDIRKQGYSFNSGEVGYRFLLGALDRAGHSDVIYKMNNQSDRPGYGYQLKMGATALTEKWDAGVGDFGSQNHFMSGQINEWFFHGLLGIAEDEHGPGFSRMTIKPSPVSDLEWVKGSYESNCGLILSSWKRKGNFFSLNLTIPANTIAKVYLPADSTLNIKESKKPVTGSKGVKFLNFDNGYAIYEVVSGNYQFQSLYGPGN